MKQIIVIGGGAAGLMAAVIAGREGPCHLIRKMNMVGKKWALPVKAAPILLIVDMASGVCIKNSPGNGKFLYERL